MRAEGVSKQTVVHEAAQLFNHIGYSDRYFADVWRACVDTETELSWAYETPDQFARAAFAFAAGQSVAHLHRVIAAHASAPDQLAAIFDGFEYLFSRPPLKGGCALFNTLTEEGCDPDIKALARRELLGIQLAIEHVLRRGRLLGDFVRSIDPPSFAAHITSTLEGAFRLSRVYQTTTYLRSALQHLRRMAMMNMCA
ncbi:MAG: hypothetical protein R2834_05805 [Rhodothermales bacterium]